MAGKGKSKSSRNELSAAGGWVVGGLLGDWVAGWLGGWGVITKQKWIIGSRAHKQWHVSLCASGPLFVCLV